jgi:ABC-type Fe3+-hydroxamate transport system substrate-binding protein
VSADLEPGSNPARVVSLIPSMTDSFVTLGLGKFLVGITDYCEVPASLGDIHRVGGVLDARKDEIAELAPDLIILNREENSAELADWLRAAGFPLWITFPRTVRQAVADLRDLALAYPTQNLLQRIVWLEKAMEWLESTRPASLVKVFCPIWREGSASHPSGWTTFNGDTYANDLLSLSGAENVFAARGDARYPHVEPQDVEEAQPECILLPSEPFSFQDADLEAFVSLFPSVPAIQNHRIFRIDGRLVFWHGTRLGESIRVLPELLAPRFPSPAHHSIDNHSEAT